MKNMTRWGVGCTLRALKKAWVRAHARKNIYTRSIP
nr:MAG TPA: hypothetical protein [Caudoviricetes sp.]DAS92410.1 MAG TPA: hypothetical protein [Caudoviricetes sp.]